jgi:NADPH:quinone reductase-like Zn-dependent oxidoreductase
VWGDIGANTATKGGQTKELGAYAPTAVALEAQLATIPGSLSFSQAGALPKVALTTYKAFAWYAGAPAAARWTRANATVLVLGGSGGTGSVGIQMAKSFGAKTVITTTSSANFAYCKRLGADALVDYHAEDWWSVLDDGSVDVVYDTVGQVGIA